MSRMSESTRNFNECTFCQPAFAINSKIFISQQMTTTVVAFPVLSRSWSWSNADNSVYDLMVLDGARWTRIHEKRGSFISDFTKCTRWSSSSVEIRSICFIPHPKRQHSQRDSIFDVLWRQLNHKTILRMCWFSLSLEKRDPCIINNFRISTSCKNVSLRSRANLCWRGERREAYSFSLRCFSPLRFARSFFHFNIYFLLYSFCVQTSLFQDVLRDLRKRNLFR